MQAVRNENIEMVKFLLSSGVIVNDFSFLGMSVLSLSCAISNEMFDLIYGSCPSALEYATRDDINPLCVAALKNDKYLFFKLINLGLDVNKANAFTHTMIKRSTVPEIAALAKSHLSSEDYWNDLTDIEELLKHEEKSTNIFSNDSNNSNGNYEICNKKICIPKICLDLSEEIIVKDMTNNYKHKNHLHSIATDTKPKNLISPTLSYFNESTLPLSPVTFIAEDNSMNIFGKLALDGNENRNPSIISNKNQSMMSDDSGPISPLVLRRCQSIRPPNLKLRSSSNDSNATLSFTPQFSPTKTPNLPQNIHEDNVFDETTPTPPKYKTPPRGIILDRGTTRLIFILERFGLKRHISTFLKEEVDLELFLTLNDIDLIEIGIDSKSERLILLSVINECKGCEA